MVKGIFTDHRKRSEFFVSEDEQVARMMCIAANGRDEARGVFRLGGRGETPLRVARDDGQPFWKDPIFKAINATLTRFAQVLTGKADATFLSPFFNRTAEQLNAQAVTLSHPLGGCRMADTAEEGVVDRFGRVWNTAGGVHPGLYVADASIIPTALGVNPSLTISALALRCADRIIEELPPVQAQQASGVCQNVVYVPKLVGDPEPAHT
jgi:choline dehydrogenase-like flavoprotein